MKKSARIALHCLLAMVLTIPLVACGSDTKDTTPKKDMSANTREQLAELAKSDERLTGELENKTIKWMSDWDINSDDTGKTTPIELAVFQERYGGQIEWHQTTYGARYDNLANAINSDGCAAGHPVSQDFSMRIKLMARGFWRHCFPEIPHLLCRKAGRTECAFPGVSDLP